MTPAEAPRPASPGWARYARAALSLILLASLIAFALRNGHILRHLDLTVLSWNVLVSLAIVSMNAAVLKWISHGLTSGTPLRFREAALVTSMGSLANSAGGLPIGTALSITVLVKRHRYRLDEVLAGKLAATGFSVACLAWIAAAAYEAPGRSWPVNAALAAFGAAALAGMTLAGRQPWFRLRVLSIVRALTGRLFAWGLFLALPTALLMIVSYWIVIHHYLPQIPFRDAAVMVSASLMLGFGLGANSLGGLQEILVGLSAVAFQVSFASGVELGLFIRLASLVASACILLATLLAGRGLRR